MKIKKYLITKGILFILLGILLLFRFKEIFTVVIIFFALESVVSLLYGVYLLSLQNASYLKSKLISITFLQLIISLVVLFFPNIIWQILSIIIVIIGLLIIFFARGLIKYAFFRKANGLSRSRSLIIGFLLIIMGFFIAGNAFLTLFTLFSLVGYAIMLIGFSYLIQGLRTSNIYTSIEMGLEEEE